MSAGGPAASGGDSGLSSTSLWLGNARGGWGRGLQLGRQVPQRVGQQVDVLAVQHQRRQQAEHVRVGARSGDEAAREKRGHHLLRRRRGAQPDQQPLALHADDRAGDARPTNVSGDVAHARQQALALDGIERSDDHRAGERTAAEGAAELADADAGARLLGGQHGAGGEAAGEALGDGEQVGRDVVELRRERLAGAPHAALHLVEDKQRAGAPRQLARGEQVVAAEVVGAGHALHGLEDERRNVAGAVARERRRERVDVAARHEGDVERRAREAVTVLAPRHRGGRGGAAVEGALERHHPPAAGLAEGEQQRVLVRLGAAVDEEDPRQAGRREGDEPRRRLVADRHRQRIALEEQRRALLVQRREQARVAVPEQRHRVAAPEVEHAAPARVLQPHPLPAHGREGQLVVDRQQRRRARRGIGRSSSDWIGSDVCSHVETSLYNHPRPGVVSPAVSS